MITFAVDMHKMAIMRTVTLFFLLTSVSVLGQTNISGTVKDQKGEGIPGANVLIKDSYDGASSAIDGSFHFLSTETGSKVIVVTFVGFRNCEQIIELNKAPISLSRKAPRRSELSN